jgi:hypothetical protein
MIIWLSNFLEQYFPFFRLFEYLSFRAILSIITALSISLWMGPKLIRWLQNLQIGQVVRDDGPEQRLALVHAVLWPERERERERERSREVESGRELGRKSG